MTIFFSLNFKASNYNLLTACVVKCIGLAFSVFVCNIHIDPRRLLLNYSITIRTKIIPNHSMIIDASTICPL
jgi:hypothetical protein